MKKLLITAVILLGGCASTYTKDEINKAFEGVNQEFTRQQAYIAQLNNTVYKQQIEKGKKAGCEKIILTTGECAK